MKSRKLYDALGRRLQVPRNRLQDFPATQWQINDLIDDVANLEATGGDPQLAEDVVTLQGEVLALQGDVGTLQTDYSTLSGDVSTLTTTVEELAGETAITIEVEANTEINAGDVVALNGDLAVKASTDISSDPIVEGAVLDGRGLSHSSSCKITDNRLALLYRDDWTMTLKLEIYETDGTTAITPLFDLTVFNGSVLNTNIWRVSDDKLMISFVDENARKVRTGVVSLSGVTPVVTTAELPTAFVIDLFSTVQVADNLFVFNLLNVDDNEYLYGYMATDGDEVIVLGTPVVPAVYLNRAQAFSMTAIPSTPSKILLRYDTTDLVSYCAILTLNTNDYTFTFGSPVLEYDGAQEFKKNATAINADISLGIGLVGGETVLVVYNTSGVTPSIPDVWPLGVNDLGYTHGAIVSNGDRTFNVIYTTYTTGDTGGQLRDRFGYVKSNGTVVLRDENVRAYSDIYSVTSVSLNPSTSFVAFREMAVVDGGSFYLLQNTRTLTGPVIGIATNTVIPAEMVKVAVGGVIEVQDTLAAGSYYYLDLAGELSTDNISPYSNRLGVAVNATSIKWLDNSYDKLRLEAVQPDASVVGKLRYREEGSNSFTDICMRTGASTYAWINIVQYNW